jgi:hypothetical protein
MGEGSHGAHHHLHHPPVELAVAAVMSIAGVLSSWSAYQSSLWDGAQFLHYSRTGAYRLEASQTALDASMTRSVEVGLFGAWAEARLQGNERLASFYAARFPPALRGPFAEWLAQRPFENPQAAASPFSLPSYRPRGQAAATAMEAKAEEEFRAAIGAKHHADAYDRAAAVLSSAMFLAGIGQVFKHRPIRLTVTMLSVLILVAGAALVVFLPIRTLVAH